MRITYELPPIGQGGFGRVYAARTLGEESRALALKKTRISDYVENPALLHEACGLVLAQGHPSIPEVFGWGRSQFYEYLATELLDCNLTTKFKSGPLTRRNFVSIVLQMFAAVAHVHSRGILHCDIKPDHFLFGTGENSGRIYLVDFNLWTPWCKMFDSADLEHCDEKHAARGFRGTFRYASIDCHLDRALSRKDDIESLAYTIFELYAAALPWSWISDEKPDEIMKSKQAWQATPGSLQGSCDYPLGDLACYPRSLEFLTEPDYERWRREFWRVDNPTAPLPDIDPLYDPNDTTERLPRNMGFISKGPGGQTLRFKFPNKANAGRMHHAPGSDHDWIPVSDGWSHTYTMLDEDTLYDEQDIIQNFVEPITEPPTTTRSYLDAKCPPEVMREFDDPIPFLCISESEENCEEAAEEHGEDEQSPAEGDREEEGKQLAAEGEEMQQEQSAAKEAERPAVEGKDKEGAQSVEEEGDSKRGPL